MRVRRSSCRGRGTSVGHVSDVVPCLLVVVVVVVVVAAAAVVDDNEA